MSNRGEVYLFRLTRVILFNGQVIEEVIVELDHINYGLNKKTGKLNKKRRLNFTLKDIEKFIFMLDEEDITPIYYENGISKFLIRIDSPIRTKFYQREFIMILTTNIKKAHQIHTVTLYPNW